MQQESTPLILVVDDDPVLHAIAEEEIVLAGWRYPGCSDGSSALAAMSAAAPDLVLLDVHMPGWDGFETCRRMRARGVATE